MRQNSFSIFHLFVRKEGKTHFMNFRKIFFLIKKLIYFFFTWKLFFYI